MRVSAGSWKEADPAGVNRGEVRNCCGGRNLLRSFADPSSRRVRRLRNVGPRGLPFPSPPLN